MVQNTLRRADLPALPEITRTTMGGMKKRGPARKVGRSGKPAQRDPGQIQPDAPNRRKHQRWARQSPSVNDDYISFEN
jgi:hypothetical protein